MQAWPEIEAGSPRSSSGDACLHSALSWAQVLPRGAEDSSYTAVISSSFSFCHSCSSSPHNKPEGEGAISVWGIIHHKNNGFINIQSASTFAESLSGKSNTSVKSVFFVKVRHNRLAGLVSNLEFMFLCGFIVQLVQKHPAFWFYWSVQLITLPLHSVYLFFLPFSHSKWSLRLSHWRSKHEGTRMTKAVTCGCQHHLGICLWGCVALRACTHHLMSRWNLPIGHFINILCLTL